MTLYGAAKAPAVPSNLDGSTQAALTESSGDTTPDETVADVSTVVTGVDGTASNAASKVDVDARLVAIDSNFADLARKINNLITHMNDGRT